MTDCENKQAYEYWSSVADMYKSMLSALAAGNIGKDLLEWPGPLWGGVDLTGKPDDVMKNAGGPKQGDNFMTKVRKHIDQVRNRGTTKEDIPSPGAGGKERVWEIIQGRVQQGGGEWTNFAGKPAIK